MEKEASSSVRTIIKNCKIYSRRITCFGEIWQAIKKKNRKAIFKFRLWKPSKVSVVKHETNSILSKSTHTVRKKECYGNLIYIPLNLNRTESTFETKLVLLNVRSANNKSILLNEYILQDHVDLFAMTETWLQENDKYTVKDLCPPGYKYIGIPRTGSRGGGAGFVYREAYDVKLFAKLDTNGLKF